MKQRTPVWVNIILVITILYIFFYMIVQTNEFLISPYFLATLLLGIVLVFLNEKITDKVENKKFQELTEEQKRLYLEEKKVPYFTRLYRRAFKQQSEAEEKDILIDHGFDGIMELDNQLPKWWLGLFWFGVAYCVVYLVFYFGGISEFADTQKEYDKEYRDQMAAIALYESDPKNIVTIDNAKYSADNIQAGEEVYKANCVSCHMDNGKGGIGPNLTDKHWINQPEKTLFKNIYHVVHNGSPNNPSMQAFGKNGVLTGKDIQNVAAYIYHINQEKDPITPAQGGAQPQGNEVTWEQ